MRLLVTAAAAVAASFALAGAVTSHHAGATPLLAELGTEQLCQSGTGLPPGWGSDARAGLVRVPAGAFTFGSTRGYPDERPASAHKVAVAALWIDQTEVTNAQFAHFVRATGYVTQTEREGAGVVFHTPTEQELARRPYAWWSYVRGANWKTPHGAQAPAPNQPVTMVTQADALAYARWLGRDLPTEAEWEYAGKAGRGDDLPDNALDTAPVDAAGRPTANYWQGPFPLADTAQDGHAGLAPVGCYAPNAFGLHDMIGNAWEWTKDAYTGPRQPHANGNTAVVAALAPNHPAVIKGGSFLCAPSYCVRYRASARESQEADLGAAHIGFRTVLRGE